MRRKEDIYIAVLKFGKDNIGKPFKFTELEKRLKDKGYEYEEFALRQFFAALFISVESPHGNDQNRPIDPNQTFFLEQSGYFHLLEFQELESARKSSLQAIYFAVIAIFISVASTCISIYYSNKQLNNPTTISNDQFEALRKNNLDSIILELRKTQTLLLKKDASHPHK
jgi:hypothetical protein